MSQATAAASATTIASPFRIRSLTIPNRFAMAPMTRRMALPGNVISGDSLRYYAARATGGVGLIVTEGVHVNADTAVDAPNTPQCATPAQVGAWKAVADAVHACGGAIAMQIWHTGMLSAQPVGPSQPNPPVGAAAPTVLDNAGMELIANQFAATAVAAVQGAGFDCVEIHGAHGYLLDSFASRRVNLRTDEYGIGARHAFPCMVVRAVRAALGPDVPIIYRFSQWTLWDYDEVKFEDTNELAAFLRPLVAAGVDCFHASTRWVTRPGFPKEHPSRTLAGWTKELTGMPVIAVGGIGLNHEFARGGNRGADFVNCDPTPATNLIESGEVDMLAIGRVLLTDKDYCNKVLAGRWMDGLPYTHASLSSL